MPYDGIDTQERLLQLWLLLEACNSQCCLSNNPQHKQLSKGWLSLFTV
jgi:hypothetical protein